MDEQQFESLNVIPLVDVMLVLLTIVLTTASFIATGRIPLALPQATHAQPDKSKDRTIELAATGALYLDGFTVSKEDLETRLKGLPADTVFLIRADRTIALQNFIDVADVLKRLNFSKVAVQTQTLAR